ncbi:TPA: hypothetical protein ACOFCC_003427 [Stenotrophomonas maltophilia]|uniref:hypothetical protein n=1 Tax=Stenotrophomonas sp. RAC2 TaxID=3064902 RepID=UPI0027214796|nr:hypothetical protein [Stenotrophomonas sp. RAC2]MDV9041259.1 hypothetical protein [Stenotrophomonas sp. RAC2]
MTDLIRAISMFGAGGSVEQVEHETALEIVGEAAMARENACAQRRSFECSDLSPFRATSNFAELFAAHVGDRSLRHDMRVCDVSMFRMLWAARQAADMLGVPYGVYIDVAVRYLRDMKGKKRITPKMLIAPDVQLHVMDRWNAEMSVDRVAERQN